MISIACSRTGSWQEAHLARDSLCHRHGALPLEPIPVSSQRMLPRRGSVSNRARHCVAAAPNEFGGRGHSHCSPSGREAFLDRWGRGGPEKPPRTSSILEAHARGPCCPVQTFLAVSSPASCSSGFSGFSGMGTWKNFSVQVTTFGGSVPPLTAVASDCSHAVSRAVVPLGPPSFAKGEAPKCEGYSSPSSNFTQSCKDTRSCSSVRGAGHFRLVPLAFVSSHSTMYQVFPSCTSCSESRKSILGPSIFSPFLEGSLKPWALRNFSSAEKRKSRDQCEAASQTLASCGPLAESARMPFSAFSKSSRRIFDSRRRIFIPMPCLPLMISSSMLAVGRKSSSPGCPATSVTGLSSGTPAAGPPQPHGTQAIAPRPSPAPGRCCRSCWNSSLGLRGL